MSSVPQRQSEMPSAEVVPYSHFEQLREAREIILHEAAALTDLAGRLDAGFCAAVQTLHDCRGSVIVTGMGKAGQIGKKIAATLSSTGTPAHFLHPADAVHGDLGCVSSHDVVLALSNSGETEEIHRLISVVQRIKVLIVAITATEDSTLGREADAVIRLGRIHETGHIGLAPSTSTTAMLAVGDALALVVSRMKEFSPLQFSLFHPAGSLGRKLTTVGDIMRQGEDLRIAMAEQTVRDVFTRHSRPGRRTGAVMLIDDECRLCGLFTDSDLARLLERRDDAHLDRPIQEVMTAHPIAIRPNALLDDAERLLSQHKISELPVVDDDGKPVGLVDITDVIGELPAASISVGPSQKVDCNNQSQHG